MEAEDKYMEAEDKYIFLCTRLQVPVFRGLDMHVYL